MARVEAARSRATLHLKIFSILLNRFGLLIHRRSVRWLSLGNMCALWGGDAAFGGNAAFGDNAALHAVWVFTSIVGSSVPGWPWIMRLGLHTMGSCRRRRRRLSGLPLSKRPRLECRQKWVHRLSLP